MRTQAIEVFAPSWRSLVDCRGSHSWRPARRCWRADGRRLRTENFTVELGGPEGRYIKPSQLLSGYSQSEYPDEVAQVIDFFLNDKGANKILGTERGVSGNSQIREMLRTEVPKTEQQVFDYLQLVSEQGAPLPPPPPPGAAEVAEIVLRTNEDVSFGRASVDEAVSKFFSDAKSALEKASQ
jgi:multiple sugar transport system substrate-binding protein